MADCVAEIAELHEALLHLLWCAENRFEVRPQRFPDNGPELVEVSVLESPLKSFKTVGTEPRLLPAGTVDTLLDFRQDMRGKLRFVTTDRSLDLASEFELNGLDPPIEVAQINGEAVVPSD